MVKIIEKATNKNEFLGLCVKYGLPLIHQPNMIFSRIAEILYENNSESQYAVCDCNAKIELVDYQSLDDLKNYCKKENFDLIIRIGRDGSGLVSKLEHILQE